MRLRYFCAGLVASVASVNTEAQVPRDAYYWLVPPSSRIIAQTDASARVHLYGNGTDPRYRDETPFDGIDDTRAARLLRIAERFSPILRRNNFGVPRDWRQAMGAQVFLQVDTWVNGRLAQADSIDLARAPPPAGPATYSAGVDSAAGDSALAALLRATDPRRALSAIASPTDEHERILYLNFPGYDEKTWRREYRHHDPKDSRIYAHFFVHEAGRPDRDSRFALVVQFWFFYPFNDGPNNHEGDWEHLNVHLTTHELLQGDSSLANAGVGGHDNTLMTEQEIARLLDAAGTPLDSVSIGKVDYYFHQNVMTLDYGRPRVAARHYPRGWFSHREKPPIWEDANFVEETIRRRIALGGGQLQTHPIGFIAGNSRGLDEILSVVPRFRGSYNRNSQGTYPFPGTWRAVGPLDATEKLWGRPEPKLHANAANRAWHDAIDDPMYVTYRRDAITLLPDWERVVDQVMRDARARGEWAWFILPIRMGYPASSSFGGGKIRRTNLGHVAPMGPAYNDGWNRAGETADYARYSPRVLRIAYAPISPFTGLQDGWGILNLPIAAGALIPGVQVALAQLAPWVTGALGIFGAPPAKSFYGGALPRRFTSAGGGMYTQFGDDSFARLLPMANNPTVKSLIDANETRGAHIDHRTLARRPNMGSRVWLTLHYGDKWSIENLFAMDTTQLRYLIRDDRDSTLAAVAGRMSSRQLSAGVRYNAPFINDNLSWYFFGGYSWLRWRVDQVTLNGAPLGAETVTGGHDVSISPFKRIWPNGMYGGLGLEMFAPRSAWILGRLGYGLRAEVSALAYPIHGFGCSCLARRGDAALSLQFGW